LARLREAARTKPKKFFDSFFQKRTSFLASALNTLIKLGERLSESAVWQIIRQRCGFSRGGPRRGGGRDAGRLLHEAQPFDHGVTQCKVEPGDDLRAEQLQFHGGGAGAGEGEGAAREFNRRGAGFEVGAGEFRPVRQQLRGGGGAAFEDRAEDGAEQSGDPARGIVAPWRFNRQILRL